MAVAGLLRYSYGYRLAERADRLLAPMLAQAAVGGPSAFPAIKEGMGDFNQPPPAEQPLETFTQPEVWEHLLHSVVHADVHVRKLSLRESHIRSAVASRIAEGCNFF